MGCPKILTFVLFESLECLIYEYVHTKISKWHSFKCNGICRNFGNTLLVYYITINNMVPNTQCSSFSQTDVGKDPWKIRNETFYCVPDDEIPLFTLLTLNFRFLSNCSLFMEENWVMKGYEI